MCGEGAWAGDVCEGVWVVRLVHAGSCEAG